MRFQGGGGGAGLPIVDDYWADPRGRGHFFSGLTQHIHYVRWLLERPIRIRYCRLAMWATVAETVGVAFGIYQGPGLRVLGKGSVQFAAVLNERKALEIDLGKELVLDGSILLAYRMKTANSHLQYSEGGRWKVELTTDITKEVLGCGVVVTGAWGLTLPDIADAWSAVISGSVVGFIPAFRLSKNLISAE